VIKDGKMINLSWTSNNDKKRYSIDFRDSLLLPFSLRSLAQALDVELKSFFPF
jgi:hypothetical protein